MENEKGQVALFEDEEKAGRPLPRGRDELNLAEFPLAALSDRIPEGKKSLVFEDRIWDKGAKQWVDRKLTITGSEEKGLPTFKDDEVLTAMIQCSAANGFTSKTVPYRQADIVRYLGWRDEGWSYRRVKEALERWVSVTLEYKNAWWNQDEKLWMDERFHIISNLTTVSKDDGTKQNAFVWNDIIWKSLQQGYVKSLDLNALQSLHRPTAKRLYRLLDKRFYKDPVQKFDLAKLGYGKLGLSRAGGVSKLKQKLAEPIKELEELGFLKPATKEERFCSIGKGHWEVIFEKARGEHLLESKPKTKLEAKLEGLGLDEKAANRLILEYPEEFLWHKLEVLDYLLGLNDEKTPQNPVGFFIASLKKNYGDPSGFKKETKSEENFSKKEDEKRELREWAKKKFEEGRLDPTAEEESPFQSWEELNEVWINALQVVALPEAVKERWLQSLVPVDLRAGILEVVTPTQFMRDYVDRFSPKIKDAWRDNAHVLKTVVFLAKE